MVVRVEWVEEVVPEVELVSGESDDDVGVCLSLELFDPRLCLLELGGFGDVIYDYGSLGVAVVHRLQGMSANAKRKR